MGLMTSIVSVSHLTKIFGSKSNEFTAVDNVSFSIAEGEIVGLLGPNGAGKTTTIFMLLNLIYPTSGTIRILDMEYLSQSEKILQNINYSSTYVEMSPRLTVKENLIIIAKLYSVPNATKKVLMLAEKFSITNLLNWQYQKLSEGQKTRISLCKAFLNDPKLLLLDEPTASLDPDVAAYVRGEIIRIQKQGVTVLITSHNMAEVEEVCDRVLFIDHGKIVAVDTPDQLAKKVRQIHVNLMIKDGQKRTLTFAKKAGFTSRADGRYITVDVDERDIAYLLAGLADCGVEYTQISIDKPTLEDYFIKMTHKGKI